METKYRNKLNTVIRLQKSSVMPILIFCVHSTSFLSLTGFTRVTNLNEQNKVDSILDCIILYSELQELKQNKTQYYIN